MSESHQKLLDSVLNDILDLADEMGDKFKPEKSINVRSNMSAEEQIKMNSQYLENSAMKFERQQSSSSKTLQVQKREHSNDLLMPNKTAKLSNQQQAATASTAGFGNFQTTKPAAPDEPSPLNAYNQFSEPTETQILLSQLIVEAMPDIMDYNPIPKPTQSSPDSESTLKSGNSLQKQTIDKNVQKGEQFSKQANKALNLNESTKSKVEMSVSSKTYKVQNIVPITSSFAGNIPLNTLRTVNIKSSKVSAVPPTKISPFEKTAVKVGGQFNRIPAGTAFTIAATSSSGLNPHNKITPAPKVHLLGSGLSKTHDSKLVITPMKRQNPCLPNLGTLTPINFAAGSLPQNSTTSSSGSMQLPREHEPPKASQRPNVLRRKMKD